jgi:hypothetical protein
MRKSNKNKQKIQEHEGHLKEITDIPRKIQERYGRFRGK